MDDIEVDGLKNLDEAARRQLERQITDLGKMIQKGPITPQMVERIEGLAKILPNLIQRHGLDMCDKGKGAQAARWEVDIGGITWVTCAHNPPHLTLK